MLSCGFGTIPLLMSPLLAPSQGYVLSPYLLDDTSRHVLQAHACIFFLLLSHLGLPHSVPSAFLQAPSSLSGCSHEGAYHFLGRVFSYCLMLN